MRNPHPSIHFAQHGFAKHSGRADLIARSWWVRTRCAYRTITWKV